jgi:hypothetical protein
MLSGGNDHHYGMRNVIKGDEKVVGLQIMGFKW